MAKKIPQPFVATTVNLSGSNLIEASAGTGKTYSIAILVLRLLLEQGLHIKEILMVTFTKAAVAELEERIRLFVRLAYKVAQGEEIKDATITNLVNKEIIKNPEEVKRLLKEAVLFLDETSVLTIHSFCQQTLNEFAFETQQLFGVDLMQDSATILEDETNKFWRKYITGIPTDFLSLLIDFGFRKEGVKKTVNNHLAGKRYFAYQTGKNYNLSLSDFDLAKAEITLCQEKLTTETTALKQYIIANNVNITAACEGNTTARKNILPIVNDVDLFLETIIDKRKSAYINNLFDDILTRYDALEEIKNELAEIIAVIVRKLNCHAIQEISEGVNYYKNRYNQITYDDLISNLHHALVNRNSAVLKTCLQQKYKAVFVDEFQDTDRLQYEIFEAAFSENTTLFYIGDPKQSIYAWRKADIFTYFKAKEAVNNLYGMNQNFRSSERLIEAMNVFFKPKEDFETFHFAQAENSIDYISVESPTSNNKGNIIYKQNLIPPIQIIECTKKDFIQDSLSAQIIELLNNKDYQIYADGAYRNILPKDIGILIRTKKQGVEIKNSLTKYGIPAITIDDGKVLQSEEAAYVLYILEAINEISTANINKALLSPFTGFQEENILALDSELTVELFRKYKATWEKDGVYAALKEWIKDFSVENHLLKNSLRDGERLITNLYQLIELLHKTQSRKSLNALELISWLKRGLEGMATEGDEFEQRIENDEEAIKIVTIHKSKGLEYKIVFAPNLDLLAESKHLDCSFRDPETGDYISAEKPELTAEQNLEVTKQAEQENRRLIYVAITRAVSQCFVYRNTFYKNSSLTYFTDVLKELKSPLINFNNQIEALNPAENYYKTNGIKEVLTDLKAVDFKLSEENWRRMSYSMLRAEHPISIKPKSKEQLNDYDNFIFNQLKKGAKTGNMLHFILENIHFHDKSKWFDVVNKAIDLFVPQQQDVYAPMLMELLHHVLNTTIKIDEDEFKLSEVNSFKCIHEFEFDFTVNNFIPGDLNKLSNEELHIDVKAFPILEGIMNGKIDLFFEHKGKFYVLDWKSNYLGDAVVNYEKPELQKAMSENNYHLQYLIYSLAVKKYLESRLTNFNYKYQFGGVIYLFLRGMRTNSDTGIFTYKPQISTIANLDVRLTAV
ncbi:UvrD-helicase domain-containing protein [Pedobacter alpinus]|uniref:RecBCD enzyme subunit RecB n=1 Tax=Pedobacter alpinus TaxID=1590643 RepID=A0ABW5TUH6_9SPHI